MRNRGLTAHEVEDLTARGYDNKPVVNQSKTVKQIITTNTFTYFNLIFIIFSLLLIAVKSYRDLSFMPVIILNTLIGIIQEVRSKRVLDKLIVLSAPKAKVIRDGMESTVDAHSLVLGDSVIFGAGNQICADAQVIEGEVQVNEALITGESDELTKRVGDKLLSGSFIVSGECIAILEKVGHNSYVARLTMEAKKTKHGEQSEMMRSLNKLVKVIGILLIPIGLSLFSVQHWIVNLTITSSVVSSIAAMVGMIPEGLYLLASVALVVSVMRLARKNVVVHEMACIETLARVDVLCVDKTGTITENSMKVNEILPLDNYEKADYTMLHEMLGDFVQNMSNDNATIDALKQYFVEESTRKAIKSTSFSSATKYCSVTFEDGAYILGAPEFVLRQEYANYRDIIESYSFGGYRVLVYGSYEGEIDGKALVSRVIPLALIIISNPIREEAKSTFEYFDSQGVDIKVISGDNPVTVSKVAKKAGIKNADQYVDASTLHTDEDIKLAIDHYTVFGRVTPIQKRELIRALKANGKTVAMTGDGVNDVLALKDADCSIAMASGSDAASNAAQLVLLDSDFSCMPSVVLEGRRVVNNIQRSASLFLVKNIFSMLLSIFSLIFTLKYPFVPSQLSMLGVFTIGTPAFFLALQPNKSIIKGHFLTNVFLKALPAGLTDFLSIAVLSMAGEYFHIPDTQLSTIAILILLAIGIVTLIRVCNPFNIFRVGICVSMMIGIILSILFLHDLFALYQLTTNQILFTVINILVSIGVLFALSHLVDKISSKKVKRVRKIPFMR